MAGVRVKQIEKGVFKVEDPLHRPLVKLNGVDNKKKPEKSKGHSIRK